MNNDPSSPLENQLQASTSFSPDASESINNLLNLREKKLRYKHKRLKCLDDVVRRIDELFFIELFALYYLDNFSSSLLLRGLLHSFYLTSRPTVFPQLRKEAPYLSVIFGSNLFCAFRHAHYALPVAGEISRGYLHGSLVIDFVGQKAPTSKAYFILFDLALLLLQLLLLAAHAKRAYLEQYLAIDGSNAFVSQRPVESLIQERRLASAAQSSWAQTHDAEERGVQRHEELERAETQGDTNVIAETLDLDNLNVRLSELDSGEAMVASLQISGIVRR